MKSSKPIIIKIQYLRGLAALMVVLVHLQIQRERLGSLHYDISILSAGVDIFFVISGFVMWFTTSDLRLDPKEFLRRRIIRIVPIYWAITGVMLVSLLVYPKIVQTAVIEQSHVLASFLFFPYPNPVSGEYTPLLIPGWTLNYEMFFYVVFAAAMGLCGRRLIARCMLIVGTLLTLVMIGKTLAPTGLGAFYTAEIILNFACGILVCIAFQSGRIVRSSWWWLLVAAGVATLIAVGLAGEAIAGHPFIILAATAIVFGTVQTLPAQPVPPLAALGDWSYSLYLVHPLVLSASYQAWRKVNPPLSVEVFSVMSVVACIAAGALCFSLVERPVTAYLRDRRKGPRPAAKMAVS